MCHLQISFDKKFPGITRIGNWYKKPNTHKQKPNKLTTELYIES